MNQFNRQLWNRFWMLAKPYWFSSEKWGARGLLTLMLLVILLVNGMNVLISFVGKDFMTALNTKDAAKFYHYLLIYAGVFAVATPVTALSDYITRQLGIYWRRWLTNHFLERYLRNRAFYEINSNPKIDNPDERISQDISSFTNNALSYLLNILSSIITLFSFLGILWSISTLLVIITLVYSFVGTIVTVVFGRRLIGLNLTQLRKEADFRYNLVHVRENAEMIAFFGGEQKESNQLKRKFSELFTNYNLLIEWQRNLSFFTTGYNYFSSDIIPALVIAPLFFAGKVEFGVITQAIYAFSQVLSSLSLIVSSFSDLSAFIAEINRLGTFAEELQKPTTEQPEATKIDTTIDSRLALEHVTLLTPDYQRVLIRDLSLSVSPNSNLLIIGQSGSGKSSLLRALASLWKSGTGLIVRPSPEEMLFLPQRPYMILGSLRTQLLYPNISSDISDEQLYRVLQQVNLAELPQRIGGLDVELDWGNILSLGEQQRLAFARLFLTRPNYAILDEATSALDLKNEEKLYQIMQATSTVFISVGHRTTLLKYHQQVLKLEGDSSWRVTPSQDYRLEF